VSDFENVNFNMNILKRSQLELENARVRFVTEKIDNSQYIHDLMAMSIYAGRSLTDVVEAQTFHHDWLQRVLLAKNNTRSLTDKPLNETNSSYIEDLLAKNESSMVNVIHGDMSEPSNPDIPDEVSRGTGPKPGSETAKNAMAGNKDVFRNFADSDKRLADYAEQRAINFVRGVGGFTTDGQSALAQLELLALEKPQIEIAKLTNKARKLISDLVAKVPNPLSGLFARAAEDYSKTLKSKEEATIDGDMGSGGHLSETINGTHIVDEYNSQGFFHGHFKNNIPANKLRGGRILRKDSGYIGSDLNIESARFPEYAHFNIKNLANGKTAYFHATIESLSESITPSWGSISPLGRSEDIHFYERADRVISMTFKLLYDYVHPWGPFFGDDPINPNLDDSIASDKLGDIQRLTTNSGPIYSVEGSINRDKYITHLNFLQQLARPMYNENGDFDKAPFANITIGEFMKNLNVVIDSINISYDPLVWDSSDDKMLIPMYASVDLTMKVVHRSTPTSEYLYYFGDKDKDKEPQQ